MPESKDPAIKLFGKTIALPDISASGCGGASDSPPPVAISSPPVHDGGGSGRGDKEQPNISSLTEDDKSDKDGEDRENHKGQSEGDSRERKEEEIQTSLQFSDKPTDSDRVTGVTEESKALSSVNDRVVSKTEEGNYGTSISLEKTAKKPDKILPCPRCNSMDTKFCYFNNYNVNQPRHFCKNCQRYWTAGGTMRNVPVGAGRRKNKNSSSQYPHMTAPEVMHTAPRDLPNGLHHSAQRTNGTVLSFGSDMPLCESMTSILNIAENTMRNSSQNGLQNPGELKIAVPIGIEKASGHMNASDSNNDLNKAGLDDSATQDCHVFSPQIACFPGAPWPFAWNSGQWSPQVPAPALCPNGFPMPFYPAAAAYWGCSVPGTWNVPWVTQPFPLNPATSSSGPNSPLGKHSRDGTTLKSGSLGVEQAKESDHDKCLWVPKTLRIDDPGEAAKSSIWTTLGIKNDKVDSIGGGGLFKAFQLKDDEKNHSVEASPTLQANPAALSRSQSFHESS